jgi:hypothetical protein
VLKKRDADMLESAYWRFVQHKRMYAKLSTKYRRKKPFQMFVIETEAYQRMATAHSPYTAYQSKHQRRLGQISPERLQLEVSGTGTLA